MLPGPISVQEKPRNWTKGTRKARVSSLFSATAQNSINLLNNVWTW